MPSAGATEAITANDSNSSTMVIFVTLTGNVSKVTTKEGRSDNSALNTYLSNKVNADA